MPRVAFSCVLCFSLIFLLAKHSHAQIYAGGSGDGFSVNNFVQPDNPLYNIYSGGSNDGFAWASFAQPDNVLYNIYSGGIQDGFAFGSFAQPDNVLYAIYSGGIEDGFAFNSYAQPDNVLYAIYSGGIEDGFAFSGFVQPDNVLYAIYSGGIEDGFAFNSFVQPDNVLYNIYSGGISDGFAFNHLGSIGSEVPLPVTLVSFLGKYQGTVIVLVWKTASELNSDHFVLEKAKDGITFNSLYTVPGAGTTSLPHEYSVIDEKPFPGINYYQLKQVDFDGNFVYSGTISVEATINPDQAVIIYPNPADRKSDIQIVLPAATSGEEAEATIVSMTGQPVSTSRAVVDEFGQIKIQQATVATLSAGVYLVTLKLHSGVFNAKLVIQ